MQTYITEVLHRINEDVTLFDTEYKKYGDGGPLGKVFYHAFEEEGKFLLPEGTPPFNADTAPIGMSPARFIQEIRKLYIFTRKDLPASRRESLFIQMLESIHPDEAKILIAIKDQTLHEMYPNITREVLEHYGFLQKKTEVVCDPKKSGKRRGRPGKKTLENSNPTELA